LAWHCRRLGYEISGVVDKRPRQAWVVYGLLKLPYRRVRARDVAAESDVLFLTVPDSSIEPEFLAIRRWMLPGTIVAHCSGTLGSDVFHNGEQQGLHTLALHPVQSFVTPAQAIRSLPGCFFVLEGSPEGRRFGRRLVGQLKGRAVVIRTPDRPLYHALCVFSSNFLNALLDAAETIAAQLCLSRRQTLRMLLPLMRSVLDNCERFGPVAGLTGPVQRGDADTVRRHLLALQSRVPELVPVYRVLSLRLIDMAKRQGSAAGAVRRVRAVLETV